MLLVRPAHQVYRETQAPAVLMVYQALTVCLVQQELRDHRDRKVHRVGLVSQDLRDLRVIPGPWELWELVARLELPDR